MHQSAALHQDPALLPAPSKSDLGLLHVARLEQALTELSDVATLKSLHDHVAALELLAKRLTIGLHEQNRIAELRIRTARKAGGILAQQVRRGGNPSGGSSAPLPPGISWNQSSRWQKLASVSDEVVAAYLEHARAGEEEVTLAGLLRASTTGAMSVHFSSETDKWNSPPSIVEAAEKALGGRIDLDPCADARRTVPANHHITEAEGGLEQAWFGTVYMNPPYGGEIRGWVQKLHLEFTSRHVTEAVALVPARTDTAWFRILREYPRCFVNGRLKFGGATQSAPFPSMVVYLGRNVARFVQAFILLGDVYELCDVSTSGS